MYASIRVANPGCAMKVTTGGRRLVRRTIDRSGDSSIDVSGSIPVGTRKIANYACIG
jgi:hypothetical protein